MNLANFNQFTAINFLSDPGAVGGPVVVPQCAQIVFNWVLEDGRPAHNVLYGRYAGSFVGTVAQANSLATALFSSASWIALMAFVSAGQGVGSITLRDVNTANQPLIQSNVALTNGGTSASPSLPNETAAVITARTALTGRANRGRLYVPGFATNALGAGNVIAAGVVTALGNWAATIPGAFSANGYTLVIGQKARVAYIGSTGTQHPARTATSVPVTSLIVRDNHWDSQRRRGLK